MHSPFFSPPSLTPPDEVAREARSSVQDAETPSLKAQLRLVQSLAEITVARILDVKKISPSQTLEAVFSALQSIVMRLDEGNTFAGICYYTWKGFQKYLQSPSQMVEILQDSESGIQKGLIDPGAHYTDLIASLKDRLATIRVQDLDLLGPARLFYDYLISLINYSETVTRVEQSSIFSSESEVSSRRRLLSSLCERFYRTANVSSSQ